ncbi:MAG: NAD(P)H-dependent oxidoreductase [Candidatus Pacebacteria bacterium]|jgi:NAD(P)H-dependent FMN reductase|nr:NAD(P)H-dependent oxidoreductase [Candidatus Paceibacterota bacterium]
MAEIINIPVILATARKGRSSEKAANFMLEQAKAYGLETELIDVRDYRIEATDNSGNLPEAQRLSSKISRADGLIIVSPEYNHGYPGELKMMLDMLYEEYFKKPVGFCGVSSGIFGGVRGVEQLRQVSIEFHMVPIREAMYFPQIDSLIKDDGRVTDKDYHDRAKKFLDELVWYAKALKQHRD